MAGFVSSLCVAGEPAVDLASTVACLLHCLPLLRTSNGPAKAAYLHLLPSVLRRASESGLYLSDCQQILSYALIHPGITGDELTALSAWQHDAVDVAAGTCSQARGGGAGGRDDVVNGPTTTLDRLSNGGRGVVASTHRDLSAARSLPVGLLHDSTSPSSSLTSSLTSSSRVSRTVAGTAAGSAVYLQHSSPPPGLPRALTPPRISQSLRAVIFQYWNLF